MGLITGPGDTRSSSERFSIEICAGITRASGKPGVLYAGDWYGWGSARLLEWPPSRLPKGEEKMKRIIHVNQHAIKRNAKVPAEQAEPVITVKTYKENVYGYTAELQGPCQVIYRPRKPLSCGAKVWIETEDPVLVDGEKWV